MLFIIVSILIVLVLIAGIVFSVLREDDWD